MDTRLFVGFEIGGSFVMLFNTKEIIFKSDYCSAFIHILYNIYNIYDSVYK